MVGAYIQGFEITNRVYTGGALDWLTPFTVLTGFGLMAGYALLGSTWLIMKNRGPPAGLGVSDHHSAAAGCVGRVRDDQRLDAVCG